MMKYKMEFPCQNNHGTMMYIKYGTLIKDVFIRVALALKGAKG